MSQKCQFAAIAVILVLTAAGCGGSQSQQQPERLALVAVADPICQKVALQSAKANAALQASTSTANSLQVLARVAPGIASSEREAIKILGALKENGSQTKDWQTMLVGMRQVADDSKQLAAAARAKNIQAIHKINADGQQIQQRLNVIARRDGFAYCGRPN